MFQDQHPNFRVNGKLFLIRCFSCNPERGTENYASAVALGICAFCGWQEVACTHNDTASLCGNFRQAETVYDACSHGDSLSTCKRCLKILAENVLTSLS